MHKLTVKISPDGAKTTVGVSGLAGRSCTDVTKAIEKALGSTESDAKTAEFNQQAQVQQKQGGVS